MSCWKSRCHLCNVVNKADSRRDATLHSVLDATVSAELLLIVWGLIFIANQRQEPDLKGRNFVKAARRGKDEVTRRTRRYFVARSGESRETVATANDEHEVRPTWDTGSNTGLQPKPEQAKQSRWTPQNKPDLLHWRQFHQQVRALPRHMEACRARVPYF